MKKLFLSVLLSTMLLSSCSNTNFESNKNLEDKGILTQTNVDLNSVDPNKVDTTTLLVKREDKQIFYAKELKDLGVISVESFSSNSSWYVMTLKEGVSSLDIFNDIRKLNYFNCIDLNYFYSFEDINVSNESTVNLQNSLDGGIAAEHNIQELWDYMDENSPLDELGNPITKAGGSSDVVVAVIDTGVDYSHPDLIANMWVNSAEIPNNFIDDDSNGYVDDYHGWNPITNTDEVMDNHGHGTHVAGIIAMSNNNIGGVGIAYNSKIMPIKVAYSNTNGFLGTSRDIAEAIEYAYLNGADIINMSFGGGRNALIEEACLNAYENALLVASAGNSAKSAEAAPGISSEDVEPSYPAALPYVVGVMSNGTYSNFDPIKYSGYEYETRAWGEKIVSTFPNNKYTSMTGTSMAAPVISGIAALIRSIYPNKASFNTKTLFSQLVNAGDYQENPNAFECATKVPTPNLCFSSYQMFDDPSLDPANNGDGVLDAGETIQIGVTLKNIGGLATNIKASINNVVAEEVNPYFDIIKDEIEIDSIGTYSTREPRIIKDDEGHSIKIEDEDAFLIKIKQDVPNNITTTINFIASCNNGLDDRDTKTYYLENTQLNASGYYELDITLCNAVTLPSIISEDTVFEGDRLYVLTHKVTIMPDVTVTFEEGSELMFGLSGLVVLERIDLINYGTLIFEGASDNRITISFNEYKNLDGGTYFSADINTLNGRTYYYYCDVNNIDLSGSIYLNCSLECDVSGEYFSDCYIHPKEGGHWGTLDSCTILLDKNYFDFETAKNCLFLVDTSIEHTKRIYFDGYNQDYNESEDSIQFNNNVIKNIGSNPDDPTLSLRFSVFYLMDVDFSQVIAENNTLIGIYNEYLDYLIEDFIDGKSEVSLIFKNNGSTDYSLLPPMIKDIQIFDSNNVLTDVVSSGQYKVDIIFSKAMDTSLELKVNYGSSLPFIDSRIYGEWINQTLWRGYFTNTDITASGLQRFNITNGRSADGKFDLIDTGCNFTFNINSSHTQSLNLFAEPTNDGIVVSWLQDDYETLLGYNIYRSESKDGYYTKLNTTIIPSSENTFLDVDAVPGVEYWYAFTVVLTDFSESLPSSKISCTAIDNIAPTIYHTPVNQAYAGNNLTINCTVSDNVGVVAGTLYYRTKGELAYSTIIMNMVGDKLSGTIPGSALSKAGLEYFIVVSDGSNKTYKGTADNPYSVLVKGAETLSYKGDVNGDGVITSKDALMIIQFIEEKIILSDDQFKRADLNEDGVLSSAEALRILQYVNGKVNTLEM